MFTLPEKQQAPCFCIGPQKGETECPCKLRETQQKKMRDALNALLQTVPVKDKQP